MFDPLTEYLLCQIHLLGYRVGHRTDPGGYRFSAEHRETEQKYVVTGSSPYAVVFELARQVGVEVADD